MERNAFRDETYLNLRHLLWCLLNIPAFGNFVMNSPTKKKHYNDLMEEMRTLYQSIRDGLCADAITNSVQKIAEYIKFNSNEALKKAETHLLDYTKVNEHQEIAIRLTKTTRCTRCGVVDWNEDPKPKVKLEKIEREVDKGMDQLTIADYLKNHFEGNNTTPCLCNIKHPYYKKGYFGSMLIIVMPSGKTSFKLGNVNLTRYAKDGKIVKFSHVGTVTEVEKGYTWSQFQSRKGCQWTTVKNSKVDQTQQIKDISYERSCVLFFLRDD